MTPHKRHLIDRVANWNGVLTGLALWPQLAKAWWTGSTSDLSVLAFSVIFINSVVWLVYACHRELKPLKISSSLNLLASAAIIVLAAST